MKAASPAWSCGQPAARGASGWAHGSVLGRFTHRSRAAVLNPEEPESAVAPGMPPRPGQARPLRGRATMLQRPGRALLRLTAWQGWVGAGGGACGGAAKSRSEHFAHLLLLLLLLLQREPFVFVVCASCFLGGSVAPSPFPRFLGKSGAPSHALRLSCDGHGGDGHSLPARCLPPPACR